MHPLCSRSSDSPFLQADIAAYSALLARSFRHWTGRALLEADNMAEALYHAPFALVAHGTQPDPIFRYANLTAQQLWDTVWDAFVQMPSRLTAEPMMAEKREQLLQQAARNGYVDHFESVRISANGKRFLIKNTTLWNVVDETGILHGQAAVIPQWEWL